MLDMCENTLQKKWRCRLDILAFSICTVLFQYTAKLSNYFVTQKTKKARNINPKTTIGSKTLTKHKELPIALTITVKVVFLTVHCHTLQRKLLLCIPRKGYARPQSQFPYSCVCICATYSQDRSIYFPVAEQADRSW